MYLREIEPVNRFIDALAELPCAEWLAIGREIMADKSGAARRAVAWAIVNAVLADRGLLVSAWYALDGVETAVCHATHSRCRTSLKERKQIAAAHGAAEQAALTLLVTAWIDPPDVEVLCRPFATVLARSTTGTA